MKKNKKLKKRKVIKIDWKVPLFKIFWDRNDLEAVSAVIKRGSYWAEGPEIAEFENSLQKYTGAKHAVVFNSGTSALHAVLEVFGVKGKEIIVPAFTFISSVNAVILAGAKPVFAEVEADSYGLDAKDVEKKIGDNTAAILPTHYAGSVARDIEKLAELAEKNNIPLVEDAAESLGAKLNNKMAGRFGKAGMYSFCQNKIIAAGEGGVLVTDNDEVAEKLKVFRSHGRDAGENYFSSTVQEDYSLIGYNYRMPSILAALGKSQLEKINKLIEMRRKNAAYYNEKLAGIEGIKIQKEQAGSKNVYQLYTIEVKDEKRDKLQKYLKGKGIMTKVYFAPVHLKTVYRQKFGCKEGMLPFTEKLSCQVLSLPFYPGMLKKEISIVADSIKSFFRKV